MCGDIVKNHIKTDENVTNIPWWFEVGDKTETTPPYSNKYRLQTVMANGAIFSKQSKGTIFHHY